MIFASGSVSSSNLIDDGRLTVNGTTVPGNAINPRMGRIESVSGMRGALLSPTDELPALSDAPPPGGGPPDCNAEIGCSFFA